MDTEFDKNLIAALKEAALAAAKEGDVRKVKAIKTYLEDSKVVETVVDPVRPRWIRINKGSGISPFYFNKWAKENSINLENMHLSDFLYSGDTVLFNAKEAALIEDYFTKQKIEFLAYNG